MTYTIYFPEVTSEHERIYFESDKEGENDCGTMWFVDKALVDYDGCYELPKEMILRMTLEGYNMDYALDTEE
jgi:hypothetical protein